MVTFDPILDNIAFLLALTFIYSLFIPTFQRSPRYVNSILTGVLFGSFTILTMNDPIRMQGGGIMDARHVIVMVAAVVSGWRGGVLAALIASAYRYYLGGLGTIPGINSIITAYLVGAIYHHLTDGSLKFTWRVWVLGLIIPFVPLTWLTTMSDGIGWRNLPLVAPSILISYPIGTYILMWLLSITYQRLDLMDTVWQFEQRQDAVFQRTPTMLMGFKPDGMIVNANPAILEFAKLKANQVVGKHRMKVNWDTTIRGIFDEFESAFQSSLTGQTVHRTITYDTDGEKLHLDAIFLPIRDTNDEIVMIFVQASDITDKLTRQEQVLALEFEQERNQILQQLIADASHHLRTPLAIIGSSIYLIKKLLDRQSTDSDNRADIDRHIVKLESAQTDLNEIVDDLLSLMRLDRLFEQTFYPHDLVAYVREVADTYQAVALNKSINLQLNLPDTSINVSLASESFQRVVQNLIENGLRYTPHGGTVTISVAETTDFVHLIVQDTGVGIPETDIPRIFDRFFRASNALAQSSRGTGLGLAIVKKTVAKHNGTISVESEVGEGTTFTVSLPRAVNAERMAS